MDKTARLVQKRRSYARRGHTVHTRYMGARYSASKRGLAFTITEAEYASLIGQPCAYGIRKESAISVGIDRKDSRLGYVTGNCVPCCGQHNKVKSDVLTYVQMLDAAKRYAIPCGNTGAGRKRIGE